MRTRAVVSLARRPDLFQIGKQHKEKMDVNGDNSLNTSDSSEGKHQLSRRPRVTDGRIIRPDDTDGDDDDDNTNNNNNDH